MLTCKEFLAELTDYLDEKTELEIRAKLERHLAECPNCWVVCDTTRKTIQVYKGMSGVHHSRRRALPPYGSCGTPDSCKESSELTSTPRTAASIAQRSSASGISVSISGISASV